MSMPQASTDDPYYQAFSGSFTSLLSWQQLDHFWRTLRKTAGAGWYIYAIGEALPQQPADEGEVLRFISEMDTLLRKEHDEDYCGIVYADSKTDPAFIKIFDPGHLGVSCGYSANPPLPGWVMSLLPPRELKDKKTLAQNRRRWWQRLWE